MSGKERDSVGRIETIKDQAADWLWRQQAPEWSLEEQAALDGWLAQSRYHLAAYWRLKAAWGRTERLAALKPGRMRPEMGPTNVSVRSTLRSVAAACAVLGLVVTGAYRWTTHEDSYATAVGQRATIKLADGSSIQLNTNSKISVTVGLWSRAVALKKGEAYFNIQHDATRPFTVNAAGHRIVDLGTQFSVRTSGDSLRVTLIQGRARLETASDQIQHHATDLTPGEIAVATSNSISVAKMPTRLLVNALAWRQGKLAFSHVTLAEAAAEFNRYNNTKIVIEPEVAELKISGTFDAGSIGPFTNMARLAFGLNVQKRQSEIILSRGKS